MSVRLILVTKTGCGHCHNFLQGPWLKMKDQLSYGIGGGEVQHIDLDRDGIQGVPIEVRKELRYVPQIFALYDDGKVEEVKNALMSPEGMKEMAEWSAKGPPRYAGTASKIEGEPEDVEPEYQVLAVTSTNCPHCQTWKESGDMERFLDSLPKGVMKAQYNLDPSKPISGNDERYRRNAINGIRVPGIVIVDQKKWDHPAETKLDKNDIITFVAGEFASPERMEMLKHFLEMLNDKNTPFLGFLILSTSPGCGHCRVWKESGGLDRFVKQYGNMKGIILMHNGPIPNPIRSKIPGYPSVIYVPFSQWNSQTPEIVYPPDPRDEGEFASWVKKITSGSGQWSNDPKFVPLEYRKPAMRQMKPIQRQRIR